MKSKSKEVLRWILAVVAFIVITAGVLFYFGFLGNAFDATVGKQRMDIERNNFKHSKSYVEGKVQDLAQYKREYDRTKDANEKQQILNVVSDQFANFDESQIESQQLRQFLDKAMGGF